MSFFLLNSKFIKDPGNPKMISSIRNSKSVLKIMLCNLDKRVLKEVIFGILQWFFGENADISDISKYRVIAE